jgi:two-component system osmolarity sensor histidine kinase EnvZ
MFLQRFVPTTLFGRFLLIIVTPTIIVQIVAVYVFYYTHIDKISKHMARSLLSEMRFIKESINDSGNQELINSFAQNIDVRFKFNKNEKLKHIAKIADKDYKPPKILEFIDILPIFDSLNRFKIELNSYGLTPFALYKDPSSDNRLTIKIAPQKGGVLTFNIPKKRIISSSKTVFILWLLIISFLTTIISTIFLRNQIKSIKSLSKAANKLGRGQNVAHFKPSGAKEIRSLGLSFIKMKERVARQVSQRTDMLSGVSHDLRTPLTRMKLQLELMPEDESIIDLKSDISDMEKMINEYLEFAKGGTKETSQNVKISDFLNKIIKYYSKLNKEIVNEIEIPENFTMDVRKNSLKRAIRNLIDNGFNYGQKVVLTSDLLDNALQITIEDDGPGVPSEELQNIFKPFYRVDNSRNLDKIGTGLGLSIVLDAISFHGGAVEAQKSSMGGLKVIINLPI